MYLDHRDMKKIMSKRCFFNNGIRFIKGFQRCSNRESLKKFLKLSSQSFNRIDKVKHTDYSIYRDSEDKTKDRHRLSYNDTVGIIYWPDHMTHHTIIPHHVWIIPSSCVSLFLIHKRIMSLSYVHHKNITRLAYWHMFTCC